MRIEKRYGEKGLADYKLEVIFPAIVIAELNWKMNYIYFPRHPNKTPNMQKTFPSKIEIDGSLRQDYFKISLKNLAKEHKERNWGQSKLSWEGGENRMIHVHHNLEKPTLLALLNRQIYSHCQTKIPRLLENLNVPVFTTMDIW